MKRVAGLVLILGLLGAMILIASCNDAIIVDDSDKLDSVEGRYTGVISYRVGSQIPEEQSVVWRFTDTTFTMWWDEAGDVLRYGEGVFRKFCDVHGEYTLTSGLQIDTSYTFTFDICDETRNPMGPFCLDNSADTLILTQYRIETDASTIIKLLRE